MLQPTPRLEMALTAQPLECLAGDTVSWSLFVRNEGSSQLSDVTAVDGNGLQLDDPFELQPHSERTLGWSSRPESDTDQLITVGGRSEDGARVSSQATAHVTVRQPQVHPPAPPDRARRQVPARALPTRRRALESIGEIGAIAFALLLLVSLFLTWGSAGWGWKAATQSWLIAALAVGVLILVRARRTGRMAGLKATASATLIALAGRWPTISWCSLAGAA